MQILDIAGILVFLACLVVSRSLAEKAFTPLTLEEKGRLMEAFSGMRRYSLIPLLAIVGLVFGVSYVIPSARYWSGPVGLAIIFCYVVTMHLAMVKRLKALGLPEEFVKNFLAARHVSHLGTLALFASLAYNFYLKRHALMLMP